MKSKAETAGVISAHECYTREEFLARTRIGDWAFKTAKRAGLRSVKVGNRVFVAGKDWLDYLERVATL